MHSGVAGTLAKVRNQFWVVKGRSAVKRVIRECRVCRRFDGGPFRLPPVPPPPKFRLEHASAFTSTGIDYLGPLFVKQTENEPKKVWIVLFTCATTRAIHLKVTEDMTTEQFMLAFRRFIALHGVPSLCVSDNGKQFSTASKTLKKWWTVLKICDEFRCFALSHAIEWRLSTEMASWMGGFCERLVGVVKQWLRKTLCGARLTLTELQTVVVELVAVVNSRPLGYVEDHVRSTPLSPAQFITPLKRDGYISVPIEEEEFRQPITIEKQSSRWRRLQGIAEHFWRYWRAQYLLSLQERHVSHGHCGSSPWSPQLGTVVHLKEDLPRACWRMGRIHLLQPSADGLTRSATVRLTSGKLVRCPVKLLYPLELDVIGSDNYQHPAQTPEKKVRPSRMAAANARQAWQQQKSESDEE